MEKINRILEVVWLAMFFVGLGVSFYFVATEDLESSAIYFVIPGVSLMMFFARRALRKRLEKTRKEQESA